MTYAKYINQYSIETVPKVIIDGNIKIGNPSAEYCLEYGYKPVTEVTMPTEEGYYFVPTYEETETEIVQSWERRELPDEPTSEDYEAALAELGVTND